MDQGHPSGSRRSAPLSIRALSKSFGSTVVVKSISLDVQAGQLLSLLGPSGCGKTTALRMVAGFEEADSGRILVNGADITNLPVHKRNLGMVFQNYSVFPHMTVAENVAFGLKMTGVGRAEIEASVRRQLDMVQLGNFADRYPKSLSGGQQQRVALARSLVTSPSILLLDEPFSALDKNLREGMQFELRALQERLGITTIMVTHDQEEALTMSDAVAVMSHGKILQSGPPDEVYNRPSSRDVSEFLGSINLFEATRRPDAAGHYVYSVGDTSVCFDAGSSASSLIFALRPERLIVEARPPSVQCIRAAVRQQAFRGSYYTVLLDVAGRDEPIIYSATDGRGADFKPGMPVFVSWRQQDVIVLENAA